VSDKFVKMRASLHRLGNGPYSAALSIIGGLYETDRREWAKVTGQREAWEGWACEQRRWSKHKCYIHPTCDARMVRWKVNAINSIYSTLSDVGHRYNRRRDLSDLELGRQLYWLLFERYADLSLYLELGDDDVRKWMKARGMEVA
jgi:hypothetical protein